LEQERLHRMEEVLSWILRGGVLLSAALIIVGMALIFVTGDTSNPFCVMEPGWIIGGSPFLEPSHVLFMGFAVLIMTPIIRVAASIMMYLRARDFPFTIITITVFMILLLSMMFGIG
jgi:uncharacterized membrane protein